MSINRAEERLFAKAVGEFRPPTPAIDLTGFLDELGEGLCSLLEAPGLLYAATNGSARSDFAASAVVLHCDNREQQCVATGSGDEDQSSLKAEMQALLWLARACVNVTASLTVRRELFVVSDCFAAIVACRSGHSSDLPDLATAAFNCFATAGGQGLEYNLMGSFSWEASEVAAA